MSSPNLAEKDEIIVPIDAEMLQQKGLAGPIISGRRKISESVLSSDVHLGASTYDSGLGDSTTIEIPVFLESLGTLEYIGFLESKAHEIWQSWNELSPEQRLKDFVTFAEDSADQYSDDVWNDDDED